MSVRCLYVFYFFFDDLATTEIYTLSLHDALPICIVASMRALWLTSTTTSGREYFLKPVSCGDRKSTRLNSSHLGISYAVFCLKKKKKNSNNYACYNNFITSIILNNSSELYSTEVM